MNSLSRFTLLLLTSIILINTTFANDEGVERCLLSAVTHGDDTETVANIRTRCRASSPSVDMDGDEAGTISRRIKAERESQWNRFVMTAHKQNYLLPYTHTSKVNRKAYQYAGDWVDELEHSEAKLQISLKVPLNTGNIFTDSDGLYFGFTVQSWWQVYADELSAPFRETNYQPEIFYLTGLDWKPFGGNTGLGLGIEHQSNGRSQLLSRSWNRVYASFLYEKDNYAISFRPWYRIKEDEKDDPLDSDGDDNPDIEKYMGHFDLKGAYRLGKHEISFMGRNNLRSDNKGAIELGWSFPLSGHLKGYVQYFNGYGESLIDYDISQERIGIGILLTDML